jgi:hypothetical protein
MAETVVSRPEQAFISLAIAFHEFLGTSAGRGTTRQRPNTPSIMPSPHGGSGIRYYATLLASERSPPLAQIQGSLGLGLDSAGRSARVLPAPLGYCDTRCLPLPAGLLLHFRNAEWKSLTGSLRRCVPAVVTLDSVATDSRPVILASESLWNSQTFFITISNKQAKLGIVHAAKNEAGLSTQSTCFLPHVAQKRCFGERGHRYLPRLEVVLLLLTGGNRHSPTPFPLCTDVVGVA